MKRSGFTMVELIFVIVIIGILSAVALPKFSGTRDRAKINTEVAAMNSLDGAIAAAIEFQIDDFDNGHVNWHKLDDADLNTTAYTQAGTSLKKANDAQTILSKIAKKTKSFRVEGFGLTDGQGRFNNNSDSFYYYPLIITSSASNPMTGVPFPKDADGEDIFGKPDRNDFWIFNPTNFNIEIVNSTGDPDINPTTIPATSIGLVDVNGTAQVVRTNIRYEDFITPTTIRQFYINNL